MVASFASPVFDRVPLALSKHRDGARVVPDTDREGEREGEDECGLLRRPICTWRESVSYRGVPRDGARGPARADRTRPPIHGMQLSAEPRRLNPDKPPRRGHRTARERTWGVADPAVPRLTTVDL